MWGIGRASIEKLATQGVRNVADFVALPQDAVRKALTVTGQRTHADPSYGNQMSFGIEPTADSMALIRSAVRAADRMWRDGFRYQKAGIILLDLNAPADLPVADLFASTAPEKSKALMAALDAVNGRFGRDTLRPGAIRQAPAWGMRRGNLSPC
ncbi:DNA polymerase V subunit UmuC [Brevundimonas diminuta]|uniref:DUF4113 domain-containing protein n=1 Tax=Brevundimonas diminuta TaxID=293 RepID=UPI000D8588F1|nr:DUF4113 domain-containing protein [Brevundimonas diminuta]SPU44588.1 DNA polymerase V subunit UmuC [Brevundimonas diminuta]